MFWQVTKTDQALRGLRKAVPKRAVLSCVLPSVALWPRQQHGQCDFAGKDLSPLATMLFTVFDAIAREVRKPCRRKAPVGHLVDAV
jgi:predicted anti-sigma-YlaC factor YlaD